MPAGAALMGVFDSTNPGAKIQPLPFSDAFGRSDGPAGQPWYVPDCSPQLQIVSGKLAPSAVRNESVGLLLDNDDFDVTFDVTYSAADSNRDDVQLAFRTDACWGPEYYLWATEPNVSLGGTTGVTLYRHSAASGFVAVSFVSLGIVEGSSHTMRVHVHGTTCDVHIDGGPPFMTATIDALPGQRGLHFIANHPGSTIDNVNLTVSGSTGTLVFSDDFTRTDSSTSAGGSWTTVRGVAGIASDQYKPVSGTSPAPASDPDSSAECISLVDVGQVDGQVQFDFTAGGSSQLDFFLAASSDGYTGVDVICSIAASTIYVFERANGPGFTLNTSAAQSGMSIGTHTITIIKNGSNLKVYFDATLKITATLAHTYTGTRIGPRVNCSLAGFGGGRYDNVNVSTL